MKREQWESEARAKIIWGEPADSVVSELIDRGVPREEALAIVKSIQVERSEFIRATGKRKIVTGCALTLIPFAAYFVFLQISLFPVKVFAFTVAVGVYGGWLLFNGVIRTSFPSSEKGDLSNQE